jgi:ribosomal protein S18 acetylase RimI-like enzyme
MGQLRNFHPDDTPGVLALWQAAGLILSRSDQPASLRHKLDRDPDLFLVLEEAGRVVGAVMGAYDGRRGWIYHLAVAPNRQGQGLGQQLVQALEARLQAKGCEKVNLLIEPTNHGVEAFYQKLGYHSDELIFMEKWLV